MLNNLDKQNGMWKGDEVGYTALHGWVKRWLRKPERCKDCNQVKKLDLANISGKYSRDLDDWEYLCRKCHMAKDGRLNKFMGNQKGKEPWNKGRKGKQKNHNTDGLRIGWELAKKRKGIPNNRPRDEFGRFISIVTRQQMSK